MKKFFAAAAAAAAMSAMMCLTAFAAGWQQDAVGWWWQNADGTWPASAWMWCDGNGDGIAECYYFNADGYMLAGTKTPDGYDVDANGAWVEDGTVQTKSAAAASSDTQSGASEQSDAAGTSQYTDDYSGVYEIEDNGGSYTLIIQYNAASNTIDVTSSIDGQTTTFTYGGVTEYDGCTFFEYESEDAKESIEFSAPGELDWWTGKFRRQ